MFDNVFNTVMNVKGKTKDNPKARMDLKLICKRPELELKEYNGKVLKPKAKYVLGPDQIKHVCQWLRQLRFPDGYVSNIARAVKIDDGQLYGLKSHDCHIFMQRLIPLAFHDMLDKPIWGVLSELSGFFRTLCASEVVVSDVKNLEDSVITTVCLLEKIFPPAFFDVMEHLIIHLPYELRVGGPVQYRWMYPFERYMFFYICLFNDRYLKFEMYILVRCMFDLKKKVRNKARVEGSICEAYTLEEISNFSSMYFEPHIPTRYTCPPRNDDGEQVTVADKLSIFQPLGHAFGSCRSRLLTDREQDAAHIYILFNCSAIDPYIE